MTENPKINDMITELRKRFSKRMDPVLLENSNLFYRFLTANDFDVDKTETQLAKHLEFRKEYKVDTILEENIFSKELENYLTHCYIGFDYEGAPVKYLAIGNMDLRGYRLSTKFIDRVRYYIKALEEELAVLKKQSSKIGNEVEGLVYIIDMKNFKFATATDKQSILESMNYLKVYQENYPQILKKAVIINASLYFSMAFSILKKCIGASMLNKIELYSADDNWKAVLKKYVPNEVLPAFLGGAKTDPDGDPLCKTFIRYGGTIPTEFHIRKNKIPLSKSEDVKKLVLPRAAFAEIELEVKEEGSFLEWEFDIKCRDIGFGIFLKESTGDGGEKITELVPFLRLDTEEMTETGVYKCGQPGTYVMLFDNSYSWLRSKEIYYRAIVVKPKADETELMN